MKLIVGNWKMFPESLREAAMLARSVKKAALRATTTRVVVCPPHVFLLPVKTIAGKSRLALGAQDCFFEEKGARTGETSPAMLRDIGVSSVILGHSERRALGETSEFVAKKIAAATKEGLSPILCIGERERTGDEGGHYAVVRDQLLASLFGVPQKTASSLVVAYEPVWAIGANAKRAATPEDFREIAVLIRKHLSELFGKAAAFRVPILYGGSVDERNAGGFLREGGADGLLIGRVSLASEQFNAIVRIADTL